MIAKADASGPERQELWRPGALFHVTNRYPRGDRRPRGDRLAGILRHGLLAPTTCKDGAVQPNLNITYTDAPFPYNSLVFLHRFGPQSYLYALCQRERFAVFVDPNFPVITQESLGEHWVVLCQDEVYVRDRIEFQHLTGIAIHPADAEPILSELLPDFERVGVPLFDYGGNVLWTPG